MCTLKPCRQFVKDKNAYVILRELHTWEKDPAARVSTENLIQVLIADDPEPGMENLNEVEIPENVAKSLHKQDAETAKDIEEETKKLALEEKESGTKTDES